MKTFALVLTLALAACSPPPEPDAAPPVQEIKQAVFTDASIRVVKHLNYDPSWDGVLAGAVTGTVGNPRVDPANQLSCPKFWMEVWRQDDPSTVYAYFFLGPKSVGIGRTDVLPTGISQFYTSSCDYEFRNGGSGTGFPYIPVGHGALYVAVWVTCPNDISRGYGGVHAFDPILVNVPAGAQMTVTMPDLNGPYGAKATWSEVVRQCGMQNGSDQRWINPTTLTISWCESTTGGCLPGSNHVVQRTW